MEHPVIISVKSRQWSGGEEEETTEVVTEGSLCREGEGYAVSYRESAITGLGDTRTTLRVEGKRAVILRTGDVNSEMIFEPGQRHLTLYETPYGTLSMGIDARSVQTSLGEHGGEVRIEYAVELGCAPAGRIVLELSVREKGGK